MAKYPDYIFENRETENLPGIVFDPANKKNFYSEDFQNLGSEITAIERELGTEVKGSFDSVKKRIEENESSLTNKVSLDKAKEIFYLSEKTKPYYSDLLLIEDPLDSYRKKKMKLDTVVEYIANNPYNQSALECFPFILNYTFDTLKKNSTYYLGLNGYYTEGPAMDYNLRIRPLFLISYVGAISYSYRAGTKAGGSLNSTFSILGDGGTQVLGSKLKIGNNDSGYEDFFDVNNTFEYDGSFFFKITTPNFLTEPKDLSLQIIVYMTSGEKTVT